MAFGNETGHNIVKIRLYVTIASHISETSKQNVQVKKIHSLFIEQSSPFISC